MCAIEGKEFHRLLLDVERAVVDEGRGIGSRRVVRRNWGGASIFGLKWGHHCDVL
jgi:hypothetical protein